VSVLEGGYSDKALLSGAMAHLTGLVDAGRASEKDTDTDQPRENWWTPENVQMVRVLSFGDKEERGKD
jgi:histone deacetylase HOS3